MVWGLWWWSLRKSANPQAVKNAKRSYSSILRSWIFPFHGSFIVVQNHSSFITFQRISLANVSFMYFKCISPTKNMMIFIAKPKLLHWDLYWSIPARAVGCHWSHWRIIPWLVGWLIAIVIVSPPIPGLTNKLINGSDPITTYPIQMGWYFFKHQIPSSPTGSPRLLPDTEFVSTSFLQSICLTG